MTFYNNLPQPTKSSDSSIKTLKVFDAYTTAPLNIDGATFDAMTGFFGSRGFGDDAAKSMAYIIIKQAILDKFNPFELIETLKGLTDIEISDFIISMRWYDRKI